MEEQGISKINEFLKASLRCYGNEVGLYSNQFFEIDQICDTNNLDDVKRFAIQYGFPQSGCVFLNFSFNGETHQFVIDDISIYAPDDTREFVLANIDARSELMDELSSEVKGGVNMQTIERVGVNSISSSINAMKMLDLAIRDLQKAEILGECMLAVPSGSDRILCCDSHPISDSIGTR